MISGLRKDNDSVDIEPLIVVMLMVAGVPLHKVKDKVR